MNIEQIHSMLSEMRKERFGRSVQLSLGQLILEVEDSGIYNSKQEPKDVYFDFGSAIPADMDSWRGSYDELALGYRLSGYDNNRQHHFADVKADKFLEMLKSTVGKEFTGWKGGEFTMSKDTPVWVANSGNSGNTAVVGVLNDGWRLVILTAYCEY